MFGARWLARVSHGDSIRLCLFFFESGLAPSKLSLLFFHRSLEAVLEDSVIRQTQCDLLSLSLFDFLAELPLLEEQRRIQRERPQLHRYTTP